MRLCWNIQLNTGKLTRLGVYKRLLNEGEFFAQ